MIRLLRAELLRLRSRRASKQLALMALILVGFVIGSLFFGHRKEPTEAQRAEAASALRQHRTYCEQNPPDCEGFEPSLSDYLPDQRFHLADADDILQGVAVGFVIIGFVLAATMIGSEWHHGLMGQLLTWEPRRTRVLAAKTLAVSMAAAAGTFACSLLLIGGLYVVTATRGTSEGAPDGFAGALIQIGLRASLLAALVAVLGTAVTSLTRSAAAAIGLVAVYAAVLERFLAVLRPHWRAWMLGDLGSAVLVGEWRVYRLEEVPDPSGFVIGFQPVPLLLTLGRGALVLGAYFLMVWGAALLDFRRRDVS